MTSQLATFKVPVIDNEPMVCHCSLSYTFSSLLTISLKRNYPPNSAERAGLQAAVDKMLAASPVEIPCIINGEEVSRRRYFNDQQKQKLTGSFTGQDWRYPGPAYAP